MAPSKSPASNNSPLLNALIKDKIDIAYLLICAGASMTGTGIATFPRGPKICTTVIGVAASKTNCNRLLDDMLRRSLSQGCHWLRQNPGPFHFAAAYNSGAINVLIEHIQTYRETYL